MICRNKMGGDIGFGQDTSTAVSDDACTPRTVIGVDGEADHVLG